MPSESLAGSPLAPRTDDYEGPTNRVEQLEDVQRDLAHACWLLRIVAGQVEACLDAHHTGDDPERAELVRLFMEVGRLEIIERIVRNAREDVRSKQFTGGEES
ncbi:MAG: hypothetical protein ACRDON_00360 [Gaiellaceae bacterium]